MQIKNRNEHNREILENMELRENEGRGRSPRWKNGNKKK